MKAATAFCLSLFLLILGAASAGAAPSLAYSTSLGGFALDVAVDSAGNAIVLVDKGPGVGYFVTKLNPAGGLLFQRPLELPPRDPSDPPREPTDIAVDPAGYIYIAGHANHGYICCEGGSDVANMGFVARLGPDATGLFYDTYFSDGVETQAHDIAVDALGRAHVHYTSRWPDRYGIHVSAGLSFSPTGSVQGGFGFSPTAPYSYVNATAMGPNGDLFAVGWQYPDSYSWAIYLQRTDASSGAVVETLLDDSETIELLDVAGGPGGGSAVLGKVSRIVSPGVLEPVGFYIAGFDPQGEEVFSRVLDLGAVVISDIAVTSAGEIVLAGWSNSSSGAFVLRLNGATGQDLSSISLGSFGYRHAEAVAVGPGGDAYVIGSGLIARIKENRPPDCSRATASPSTIWPPDRRQVRISTLGVTDPNGDPVTLKVTRILQDELFTARMPDAGDLGTARPWVRADRMDTGDGRVYHLFFEAKDPAGAACTGVVKVCVPLQSGGTCRDGGARIDSTTPR